MTTDDAIRALAERTAKGFREAFGRPPTILVAAPGRVNLIGEHTDYNDGFVLPMAIERRTVIAADRAVGGRTRISSSSMKGAVELSLDADAPRPEAEWARYVQGVVSGCVRAGLGPAPFDALVDSNVPLGGGLSSSAALEVATATLVETLAGRRLDPVEKALLCQRAEHEYAGVPCGIMDQFVSVLGRRDHALLIDCRSRETRLVPLDDEGVTVLIVNTNVRHELTGGEYAERRAQCEEAARALGVASLRDASTELLESRGASLAPVLLARARHVITEIDRTLRAADAMERRDWDAVGELMYASHVSLRDDYEVSCAELDAVVAIARAIGREGGVIGSRMTGGGFGGSTVTLVETDAVVAVAKRIEAEYRGRTGIEAGVFHSRAADGAVVLRAPGGAEGGPR